MSVAADHLIHRFDRFLRAVFVPPVATRPMPQATVDARPLDERERRHAAGLMRVNHVGEVCAQGLYAGQGAATRNESLRDEFLEAGREEGDHLAWTAARLEELRSRPSFLNPAWYAGAFAMGWLAGKAGDGISLGFVVETEKQVEAHLESHLATLPADDLASRAIVDAMRRDEIEHGRKAQGAGAVALPPAVGVLMRGVAKVMTTTAYWV